MDDLRTAAAEVNRRARWVQVDTRRIASYATELAGGATTAAAAATDGPERERLAARWLVLDAINFGSGWFPELRKRPGMSGSRSIAAALEEHFAAHGPWTAARLEQLDAPQLAGVLGQDRSHRLMGLYAASLADLGRHVTVEYGGSFSALVDSAGGSAVVLARRLGRWTCFADTSAYEGLTLPFLKRAQIAAADLHRAGVARFDDLARLTMFADNLVPHVLRLDAVLEVDGRLVCRIEHGELLVHGSAEEVELRAAAVHAVELLVGELGAPWTAAAVDEVLWNRGQRPRYKSVPRPRCRCTAY